MNSNFSAEFFRANRQTLRKLHTNDYPIVITANGLLQRGADSPYAFRQDANFWYVTGVSEPDFVLVIEESSDYLILPERTDAQNMFDGELSADEVQKTSGVEAVLDNTAGWNRLKKVLQSNKYVATIAAPPAYVKAYGMYTNPARASLMSRLQAIAPDIKITDISPQFVRMRMVKQPQEVSAIQQAITITKESLEHAITVNKRSEYTYEYEIEANITRGFRMRGSLGHAFDPIVASGRNATTIHYVANNGKLSANSLVVIDIGAEYDQYAADITRTIALGEPTERQQQVYAAVLKVQQHAYDLLKPGVLLRDYEKQVEQYMAEVLQDLGLIQGSESKQVRMYYPHAASHHLGLNVHDVADYEVPLEENMIITVEPGIYIPEEDLGVRIEDDVRITKEGIEVLSSALPATLM